MNVRRFTNLACAIALAGCGGGDGSARPAEPAAPIEATAEERRLLRTYEGEISRHCVRVSRAVVDPAEAPTRAEEQRAFAAADALVDLAARNPAATLEAGQDVRLFLSDVVENLEGSNCDPRMIARLEAGLARVPR